MKRSPLAMPSRLSYKCANTSADVERKGTDMLTPRLEGGAPSGGDDHFDASAAAEVTKSFGQHAKTTRLNRTGLVRTSHVIAIA